LRKKRGHVRLQQLTDLQKNSKNEQNDKTGTGTY
jgi:hypothetical protein